MAMSGSTYVQLITAQKLEKARTAESIKKLKAELEAVQLQAYDSLLELSAEIANKYFKDVNHDIEFTSRIRSGETLMENEINRLDLGMDMPEYRDDALDQSLQELRQKLQQWSALQKEIKSPVQESQLYRKAVDLIERSGREDFPLVENLAQMQATENKFLDDAATLAESVQSIVMQHDAEMERQVRQVDEMLRNNNQRLGERLAVEAAAVKEQLRRERLQHRKDLDSMYNELLSKFVQTSEQSCLRMNAAYHKLERRKAEPEVTGVKESNHSEPNQSSAAPHPPMWKSEIDALYLAALKEDRQRRALEEQMDKLLISELNETKIEVLDHGMGEDYLTALMDKLTALYIEASEIDLRRARSGGGAATSHNAMPV